MNEDYLLDLEWLPRAKASVTEFEDKQQKKVFIGEFDLLGEHLIIRTREATNYQTEPYAKFHLKELQKNTFVTKWLTPVPIPEGFNNFLFRRFNEIYYASLIKKRPDQWLKVDYENERYEINYEWYPEKDKMKNNDEIKALASPDRLVGLTKVVLLEHLAEWTNNIPFIQVQVENKLWYKTRFTSTTNEDREDVYKIDNDFTYCDSVDDVISNLGLPENTYISEGRMIALQYFDSFVLIGLILKDSNFKDEWDSIAESKVILEHIEPEEDPLDEFF